MVQAGSLLYAIFICLLISIVCGSLIFVFSYNLEYSTRQSIKSELINRCESCLNFYLSDSDHPNQDSFQTIDVFDDGINCQFQKTTWGAYTRLTVKSFFKKDTISKNVFIGKNNKENDLALYLCDWGDILKISGSTKILGNLKVPSGSFKKVSILGNGQLNNPEIVGLVSSSDQSLPKLSAIDNPLILQTENSTKPNKTKTIVNGFDSSPLLLEVNRGEKINNLKLKGNILLHSADTLYIDSSMELEDIIIAAPKVVVHAGFEGNIQVFASEEIVVEEKVLLKYPSNLTILSESNETDKKITISSGSQVEGGIILESTSFDQKEANKLIIDKDAVIVGDIYCNGTLELLGKVLGTVYSHKIKLETKSGSYENTLLNALISTKDRPEGFIAPFFTIEDKKTSYGIVKNL